jgi:hypothetical protein
LAAIRAVAPSGNVTATRQAAGVRALKATEFCRPCRTAEPHGATKRRNLR